VIEPAVRQDAAGRPGQSIFGLVEKKAQHFDYGISSRLFGSLAQTARTHFMARFT